MEFKSMREKLGLTQAELAKKLDVPQETLSRWENGKGMRHPTILHLAMQHLRCKQKKR